MAKNLLLAQLIADKSATNDLSINGWFDRHSDALKDTGWIVQAQSIINQQFPATEGNVRKAIVPMLYTMLGPMLADSSLLLSLLDGLGQRRTQPQGLQVFYRSGEQRTGAKLQFAFIEADTDGNPNVRLLYVGIKAEHAIPTVLLFKSTDERAKIQQATIHFTIDRSGLESTRDAITQKVASQIPAMVRNLEL